MVKGESPHAHDKQAELLLAGANSRLVLDLIYEYVSGYETHQAQCKRDGTDPKHGHVRISRRHAS